MLHLLHIPPVHVSTVDTGRTEDWVVWIFRMRQCILSYVIEQYIPYIFTKAGIFFLESLTLILKDCQE